MTPKILIAPAYDCFFEVDGKLLEQLLAVPCYKSKYVSGKGQMYETNQPDMGPIIRIITDRDVYIAKDTE